MSLAQMVGTPGAVYFANGNSYQASGTGLITGYTNASGTFTGINSADIVALINAGALPAQLRSKYENYGIVAAALATKIVASVAMTNGALTIALQPDVPRQLQAVINPGTTAITAGNLVLVYTNSGGVQVTDTLSLVVALSTAKTLTTTKGCAFLTSATVVGLVGGTSPNIQVGTNAVLALPTDQGNASLTVFSATVDGAPDSALPTQSSVDNHLITPATAPNGTHTYTFGYSFYGA